MDYLNVLDENEKLKEIIKQLQEELTDVKNKLNTYQINSKKYYNNIQKYGVEHTLQVKDFRDKSKQTIIEKYGTEHFMKCKEIQDKMTQNCLNLLIFQTPIKKN